MTCFRTSSLALAVGLLSALAHADPTPAQRLTAARLTAEKSAHCVDAQPFYWEIGNGREPLAGGSVGSNGPSRDTPMAIASASKWIYAAYVAERRQGLPTDQDWDFLHFTSGYTNFHICRPGQSVAACQESLINGRGKQNPATTGKFDYSGGHMEKHAVLMGLGSMGPEALAATVRQTLAPVLGADWRFDYIQAQPAGGGKTTPGQYARFLRATLSDQLQLGHLLGQNKVCTNPTVCPNQSIKTPIPLSEAWNYSFGHWVEDDPQVGDHAFSSPGAFGFYPWISADKRFYGMVAREERHGLMTGDPSDRPAIASVACGREIRAAWTDGNARP